MVSMVHFLLIVHARFKGLEPQMLVYLVLYHCHNKGDILMEVYHLHIIISIYD